MKNEATVDAAGVCGTTVISGSLGLGNPADRISGASRSRFDEMQLSGSPGRVGLQRGGGGSRKGPRKRAAFGLKDEQKSQMCQSKLVAG